MYYEAYFCNIIFLRITEKKNVDQISLVDIINVNRSYLKKNVGPNFIS